MQGAPTPSISEALDALWAKFLPQLEERVGELESCAAALAAGAFTEKQRQAAHAAAHKLAGVLGTFGLTRGTVLAREAEILYSGEPATDPDAAAQLSRIAAELRGIVARRK